MKSMTVDELRRALADIPGDVPVGVYDPRAKRSLCDALSTATMEQLIDNGKITQFVIVVDSE